MVSVKCILDPPNVVCLLSVLSWCFCCCYCPHYWGSVWSLFCCTMLYCFAIWGGGVVALLLLSSWCLVIVIVLCLFLAVTWVGLQCMIVVFPDHTHLIFSGAISNKQVSVWFCVCTGDNPVAKVRGLSSRTDTHTAYTGILNKEITDCILLL